MTKKRQKRILWFFLPKRIASVLPTLTKAPLVTIAVSSVNCNSDLPFPWTIPGIPATKTLNRFGDIGETWDTPSDATRIEEGASPQRTWNLRSWAKNLQTSIAILVWHSPSCVTAHHAIHDHMLFLHPTGQPILGCVVYKSRWLRLPSWPPVGSLRDMFLSQIALQKTHLSSTKSWRVPIYQLYWMTLRKYCKRVGNMKKLMSLRFSHLF